MADGSWWIPLASGALGVVGALGGTWLTQVRTNAREDRQWQRQRVDKLRDDRLRLYLDLMEYLENLHDRLAAEGNGGHVIDPIPDVPKRSRLNARVGLYAPDNLRELWRAVLRTDGDVAAEREATNRAEGVSASTLEAAREAIEETQDLLRTLARLVDV